MNRLIVATAAVLAMLCLARAEDHPPVPIPLAPSFAMKASEFPRAVADTATPRKSRVLAALYSAAVPGMGELYVGRYDIGKYFTGAEALMWLGYAGMTLFGNAMVTDAATYAASHAGAQTGGKADQFLTDVGNFSTTAQYNDKKARDGDYRLIYTTSDYNWQWDSETNRNTFRSLHLRANNLLDNTKYLLAAIVVNHFASAVDAVLQANAVNRSVHIGAVPKFENGTWETAVLLNVEW